MSVFVDQGWIYQFNELLDLTYQQEGARVQNLLPAGSIHRGVRGGIDHWDRLSDVMANDVVGPFSQTKVLNPEHSRRAVALQSSDAAILISDEHTLRSMTDPQSEYTRTIVYALGRRADKHIIDALTGSAQTAAVTAGSGVITYGTQALPSARKIGDSNAMDLARIINANELLSKASVPTGADVRVFLYGPGQLRDILAITQASSSDFTKNQIHDRGTIDGVSWEGFQWVEIADVVREDASTVLHRMLALASTTRSCIAFHKRAVGLSIARDIQTELNRRPDLQSNPVQVRSAIMMAAVRRWEGGVVQVDAKEN